MKRRLIGLAAAALAATLSLPARAQEPVAPSTADELRITRGLIAAERQSIVGANLNLTAEEAQRFWPLYLEYRGEMMKYGDRSLELLEAFARTADAMDDLTADGMLQEWLSLRKQEWAAKEKWRARFTKAIPASKVLRFYQIENKIDTAILSELTEGLPLAMPSRSAIPAR